MIVKEYKKYNEIVYKKTLAMVEVIWRKEIFKK